MANPETLMTSFENPHKQDPSGPLGTVGLLHLQGERMVTAHGRLLQETVAKYEPIWVPFAKPVFGGCTDDRFPTAKSAAELQSSNPGVMSPEEAYASIYGGMAGAAKNVLITGIAQYGEGFIAKVGGFEGVLGKLLRYSNTSTNALNVRYLLHSDEANENTDGTFCAHGTEGHGCKYCLGVGAVSSLLTSNEHALIYNVAVDDQKEMFGSDFGLHSLRDSHGIFLANGTNGSGSSFALDRSGFIGLSGKGAEIMILEGPHAPATESGLLINFSTDEVGSAKKAADIGTRVYRADVMVIVRDLLEKFKEYDLDPELLVRSIILESTAVRAVLAAGDKNPELNGKLDPRNLAMGWRGDAQAALQALK